MKKEYDFSKAEQGKFYRPVKRGQTRISFRKRIKSSEHDVIKGRVKQTTPQALFKELGI